MNKLVVDKWLVKNIFFGRCEFCEWLCGRRCWCAGLFPLWRPAHKNAESGRTKGKMWSVCKKVYFPSIDCRLHLVYIIYAIWLVEKLIAKKAAYMETASSEGHNRNMVIGQFCNYWTSDASKHQWILSRSSYLAVEKILFPLKIVLIMDVHQCY